MTDKEKLNFMFSYLGCEDMLQEFFDLIDEKIQNLKEGLDMIFTEEEYDLRIVENVDKEQFYNTLCNLGVEEFLYDNGRDTTIRDMPIEDFEKALKNFNDDNSIREAKERNLFIGLHRAFLFYNNLFFHYNSSQESAYRVIVYIPSTVITNENGAEHPINDVYFNVDLDMFLKISYIRMTRSTFSIAEITRGYVHSHCHSGTPDILNTNHTLEDWRHICLGSGELDNLYYHLKKDKFNFVVAISALEWFKLFHLLHEFAKTESLEGGPYVTFSSIDRGNRELKLNDFSFGVLYYNSYNLNNLFPISIESIKKNNNLVNRVNSDRMVLHYLFLNYLIENTTFRFSFKDDYIRLAYSPIKLWELFTNQFIKFYNELYNDTDFVPMPSFEELLEKNILIKAIKEDNKYYVPDIHMGIFNMADLHRVNGVTKMLEFKGKTILLKISDLEEMTSSNNFQVLLSPKFFAPLKLQIESYINFNFKQDEEYKYKSKPISEEKFSKTPLFKKRRCTI